MCCGWYDIDIKSSGISVQDEGRCDQSGASRGGLNLTKCFFRRSILVKLTKSREVFEENSR